VVRTARDDLLSPQEAGDRLGVSVYTVRRWIQEGRIPAYKPGKEYRIRESDLEEFLRAREVRPKGPRRSPYEPSLLNGLEEELEAGSPKDRQHWEKVLASVRDRQSEVEAKVEELVELPHSEVDLDQVKWALDEARDCLDSLMLALPGSRRRGREAIVGNFLAIDPDQWEEVGSAERFYGRIVQRLVEAGLVTLRERAGQKPEPVPVGIEV
jgi:excisionase family DNA binding protein